MLEDTSFSLCKKKKEKKTATKTAYFTSEVLDIKFNVHRLQR